MDSKLEQAIEAYSCEYADFLSRAKTEREFHDEACKLAEAKGFRNMDAVASRELPLPAGSKLYRSCGGKTIVLFIVGEEPLDRGMNVIGGHIDSPRIDLKPRPVYEDGSLVLLDTHYYGGIKKYQWVTIPLALHGVVMKADGTKVDVVIGEDPSDPVFCISDLLPHLGAQQMDKPMREAITGEGLNVIAGSRPHPKEDDEAIATPIKVKFLELLHERYGITEADLISAELELVPAGPVRELGLDRSMLLGYGHDDRACSYAAFHAILAQQATPRYTACCILCDKEEIGSTGSTGMDSMIFENTVAQLLELTAKKPSEFQLRRILRNSRMLSADVNSLHDPNFPDVSAPNGNMAYINHGVVITKYTGSRGKSGSNDASAEYMGMIRRIFDQEQVVWQTGELGKVDQGGGGTIAYMLARYEMDVVDCGVGVLNMHAPHEIAGKLDLFMMARGFDAFYRLGEPVTLK
ncbi:MAG: aminopeptidase [Lentisphaerae bacterium]|nr:MAG: aminopeptidase [Lentisphaerota bacterium]